MAVQEYGGGGSLAGPLVLFVVVILAIIAVAVGRAEQGAAERAFEAACLGAGGRVGTVGSVHGCFPESIRPTVLDVEAP